MGDSPFRGFAERHDLDYVERGVPLTAARMFSPGGQVSGLVGGSLPGGLEGIVGRLERRHDDSREVESSGVAYTRVAASVPLLPYLTCRDEEVAGLADRLIGPGGWIPLVNQHRFESIEFNRRYRIGIFRGTSESNLRQLFAPTFLDWMAQTAPEGLHFELFGGVLSVTPAGEIADEDGIRRLCELTARVADRIRSESLEEEAGGGRPLIELSPSQLEEERKLEAKIAAASFSSPPRDFPTAYEGMKPVVAASGGRLLNWLFGSLYRREAARVAVEALLRAYGETRGLVREHQWESLARELGSPWPMAGEVSLRGELPGLGVRGRLLAHPGGDKKNAYRPAAVIESSREDSGVLFIAPAGEEPEPGMIVIGGFLVESRDGEHLESEITRRDRESIAAIAEHLGSDYRVLGGGVVDLPSGAIGWLQDPQRRRQAALLLEPGAMTAIGPPVDLDQWSWELLDRFCGSLAPLVAIT